MILYRWKKLYTDYESWEALAPQYKYSGFNDYRSVLTEEQIGIFLKLLLHPNQFSIGKAIKLTTHILEKRGFTDIPKPITFRRYAEWFKKNNRDKWVLMREGEKALRDRVEPYIKRDISNIKVGEIFVADGHVLNFLVLNPFTGKPWGALSNITKSNFLMVVTEKVAVVQQELKKKIVQFAFTRQ